MSRQFTQVKCAVTIRSSCEVSPLRHRRGSPACKARWTLRVNLQAEPWSLAYGDQAPERSNLGDWTFLGPEGPIHEDIVWQARPNDLRYLELLAKQYPSIQAASTEIINLSAILHLPKGTEHFLSDIHGEYEPFLHVLRNGSGSVWRRIEEAFQSTLLERERHELATLIYYPEHTLTRLLSQLSPAAAEDWYRVTLFRLVQVCRLVSSKYTRSKMRKALPTEFAYILEELLHEQESVENKLEYYQSIVDTIISTGSARNFIVAMAELIQRLAIDHLHIIGDVYDRGPGAHIIMDALMAYHSVDFQWGNHDIVWMGAAAGSEACIANVIRICLRYANMETLEGGYGISLLPLATLAMQVYGDDPCHQFKIKASAGEEYTENELLLMARMHKAITVIQLKLEGEIIQRRPEFQMDDRLLLDKINWDAGVVWVDDRPYPLNDTLFPTVNPDDPHALTDEEHSVVQRLTYGFRDNEKLQAHVRFLYAAAACTGSTTATCSTTAASPWRPTAPSLLSRSTGSSAAAGSCWTASSGWCARPTSPATCGSNNTART